MAQYVNLGCGSRYHRDWINIDFAPKGHDVIKYDLSQGIPLPDSSCEVVYHAAVLEHFRRSDALAFLEECYRVLRPGGIIRIGVPDLEKLCSLYLSTLARICGGDKTAVANYDWIMLELYDQAVRERSGGGMLDYLRQNPLPNKEFLFSRIGNEGEALLRALSGQHTDKTWSAPSKPGESLGVRQRLRVLRNSLTGYLHRLVLGRRDVRALEIGRFRSSGEVHQWMYDRFSLGRLLRTAGFSNPVVQSAVTSRIPNWTSFHLDTLPDGCIIKPDLFFMEAVKASGD